jgi:hypothetical protein
MDWDPIFLAFGIAVVAWFYWREYPPTRGTKDEPETPAISGPPPQNIRSIGEGNLSVSLTYEVITGLVPRCTVCGSSNVTVITPMTNQAGDPWSLADCVPCRGRVYAHAS